MRPGKMSGLFFATRMWKLLVIWTLATQLVTGKTLKYQVFEEQKVGTVIARLRDDVADILAKLPSSVSLRFRAMQRGSSSFLVVREQDGEISIRTKIDREKLCEKNLNCSIQFDVLTLPTEHLQLFHVEVEVLDINDNAPQFARAVIPIEISESAAVGARIPLDSATDPDVGENSLYTYALEPNNFFKVDVQSRTDGAKYAELVVLRELDREVRSSYELQYTASDRGVPPRTGSTLLKISVADSNDNSPVFDKSSYVINLPENSPVGTLLIDMNATDLDEGTNAKIVYSFSSHVSPKIMETFKINSDSGHLTLIRRVDYEATNSYDIDVQAQDMGPNSMPAHCKILVKVVDVNDNKPDISITLMSSQGNGDAAYISEASPLDTFVALVRVEDLDSGLNGEVECKLHGQGYFKLQRTYENNYMILTNVSLDREKRSEFSLTVVAEDQGTPSLSTIKHFTVHVTDENDNAPRFEKGRYEIFKSENNAPGAYLSSIIATDPDLDTNGQVSYSILENSVHGSSISTYVTIDPSNGAIYALRTFDREDVSRISFVVQAKDAGKPPLMSNTTVILNILDENDNPPVIVVPQLWNFTADVPALKFTEAGHLVTAVRATDRDTGVNAELICSIVSGNEQGFFLINPRTCEILANISLENFPQETAELTIMVRDQGSESLSAKAVLKITLYENMENHVQVMDQGESSLDVSLIIIISLGAICALLLVIMVVFAARCNREKKDTRNSYNCRVAESTHQHHPKKPSRQIHKGDITLVPTVNGTLPIRAHHRSPSATPPMERAQIGSRQNHHSRQSLNSLVTISSNHIPESFALELAHATPPVEQVSQLLSMLHQGQYQPRPSFRGNKYSRSYRYALQDMDKFSLKDSGRGDSEAGDSDCDMGRESPVDRLLLGEGFSDLIHLEMHHRLHPATRLCTDECRVLGHSDQCWMPPLSSPASSSDYRNNMYIPGEESTQQPQLDDDQSSVDSENRKSFSTFGKESGSEEGGAGGDVAGGGNDACAAGGGAGSLLTEMNSVFQRLLPPNMDSYTECNETSPPSSSSTTERGSGRCGNVAGNHSNNAVPQDNRRGLLPGGKGPAYPPGVAAWAASTHYLNPSSGSVGNNHISNSPSAASSCSTSTNTSTTGQPPHLKWLPAMEEIPENYEEDDFDGVFHQGHQSGKRSESRHEAGMDASELVHEINKLLQDVRQN
ncbi:protocadherin-18-like isoform X1 [Solea senegalensis]|uniref:Protocadherin-18-like isoform X1 n=1 Tax=Solea senegalensis TaxID=28829 RepID=A0AAV6QA76_SOLSE|nr:protocadherin-18-like isoform X1 [Solea senegalensis]KAG7486538.1 protocadherin-18-like isoform X1 [Solea senegalensis]